MKEEWKDISGYEGKYQVSNLGHVKSVDREVIDRKCKRIFKGVEIKPWINHRQGHGYYLSVTLSWKGKTVKRQVHRLVAEAFIPNPENKPHVNHKDGNCMNNSIENLEWVTPLENNIHCLKSLHKGKQTLITFNGETHNMKEWGDKLGLSVGTVSNRLSRGYTIEEAVTMPLRKRRKEVKVPCQE